jgi:hypothetical protein
MPRTAAGGRHLEYKIGKGGASVEIAHERQLELAPCRIGTSLVVADVTMDDGALALRVDHQRRWMFMRSVPFSSPNTGNSQSVTSCFIRSGIALGNDESAGHGALLSMMRAI